MAGVPDNTDMKAFTKLKETGAGMRFRVATQEANQAVRYIQLAIKTCDEKRLEAWRRSYISACNNASKAIEHLSANFAWPPESAADRTFVWIPRGARRWTWAKS
jgi:hypothetical protein